MIEIKKFHNKSDPFKDTSSRSLIEWFGEQMLDNDFVLTPRQEKRINACLKGSEIDSYKVIRRSIILNFCTGHKFVISISKVDHLNQILSKYGYSVM